MTWVVTCPNWKSKYHKNTHQMCQGPIYLPMTGDYGTETFEIDIPVGYLIDGVNDFEFEYSRSTSSWGYRVHALSLTVVFGAPP